MPMMKCPKCKKPLEYSQENPYRPFCSERCKMVDLGQWANEEYAIASSKPVNIEQEMNQENPQNDDDSSSRGDLH